MTYELDQEVKDVKATVLIRMKFSTTLLGVDYLESDGTDEGAFLSAFDDLGISEFDEYEIVKVEKIQEA